MLKKITFINSIKHILAEYDEQICFEDRAEFHPSWPYSFGIKRKIDSFFFSTMYKWTNNDLQNIHFKLKIE